MRNRGRKGEANRGFLAVAFRHLYTALTQGLLRLPASSSQEVESYQIPSENSALRALP